MTYRPLCEEWLAADGEAVNPRAAIASAHIPTFIVHGRFDAVCMPRCAWELAARLDNARLELVPDAGHSQNEPANLEALVRGVLWLADRVD